MRANPYYHRGPIKEDRYFYGRACEIKRIVEMIFNGQSVSIIGPRHIGKTSLLFHLRTVVRTSKNTAGSEKPWFVYLNGEGLTDANKTEVLSRMLEEFNDQTRQSINQPQDITYRTFEQIIRKHVKMDQRLVFLIDEFESLANNPNLDVDFFSFLRSLIARYNIVYITASKAPLLDLVDETEKVSSPFFNIFMQVNLGLFNEEDARHLISEPAKAAGIVFPSSPQLDVESLILESAGPHPFFLQIACYHAFAVIQELGAFNAAARKEWEERAQTELRSHFKYTFDRLTEEELRALALLLDTQEQPDARSVIKTLKRKCVLKRLTGKCQFASQFFKDYVREQIGPDWSKSIAEGERYMATVLFVDIVGFTPLTANQNPEQTFQIIKQAQRIFVDTVDQHGGKVTHFAGDAMMAVFGVPTETQDDAMHAVRAALELQSHIGDYAIELRKQKKISSFAVRVGLDTGVVALGEIGGEQRTEYTALGSAVNIAQRLESEATPGSVIISEHTYKQVRGKFEVEPLGYKQLKGIDSHLIGAYQVLREKRKR